jgi:hypothetical protein
LFCTFGIRLVFPATRVIEKIMFPLRAIVKKFAE